MNHKGGRPVSDFDRACLEYRDKFGESYPTYLVQGKSLTEMIVDMRRRIKENDPIVADPNSIY